MSVIFTSLEARPFGFNAGFLFEHRVKNVLSGLLYHFIVTVLLLCAYCLGSALESVDIIGKGLFFSQTQVNEQGRPVCCLSCCLMHERSANCSAQDMLKECYDLFRSFMVCYS